MRKLICKMLGHKWNKYLLRSYYDKKLCKRCGYEEQKPPRKRRTFLDAARWN